MGIFERIRRRTNLDDVPTSPRALTPFRSQVGARLPDAISARVGDVDLPPGRYVSADPVFGDESVRAEPLLWCTNSGRMGPGDLMNRLRPWFAESGLWPLALSGLDLNDPRRPWYDGELRPLPHAVEDAASIDVAGELERRWKESFADDGEFPGLCVTNARPTDVLDRLCERLIAPLVGLVPVHRPADVPAHVGWDGAVNHDLGGPEITAVLRSWEDRFGALLINLGFDTMQLAVGAPPRTAGDARRVAVELAAFCPDIVTQGTESVDRLAASIVDARLWSFWWD